MAAVAQTAASYGDLTAQAKAYVAKYFAAAETLWDEIGTHKASVALEHIFPRPLASPELLETGLPHYEELQRRARELPRRWSPRD